MLKLFTLRVKRGDISFSFRKVLTLNVKNGDWEESTQVAVPSLICTDRSGRDKIQGRLY